MLCFILVIGQDYLRTAVIKKIAPEQPDLPKLTRDPLVIES